MAFRLPLHTVPHLLLIARADQSLADTQDGTEELNGSLAHKDPLLCAFLAVAMVMYRQYHMKRFPIPDFAEDSWCSPDCSREFVPFMISHWPFCIARIRLFAACRFVCMGHIRLLNPTSRYDTLFSVGSSHEQGTSWEVRYFAILA